MWFCDGTLRAPAIDRWGLGVEDDQPAPPAGLGWEPRSAPEVCLRKPSLVNSKEGNPVVPTSLGLLLRSAALATSNAGDDACCPACAKAIQEREDVVKIHGEPYHARCALYRRRPESVSGRVPARVRPSPYAT